MIRVYARVLAVFALVPAGAAFAQATVEYRNLDALALVPRVVSVGTSLGHARPAAVEMPTDVRATVEKALAQALPPCAADGAKVAIAAAVAPRGIDESRAHLEGWGLYLDLPSGMEKTYASDSIAPFVSVRVSLTSKDGTVASRDLFDYERLGLPKEQRLTVREVQESDPKALAALLLPLIQRHAADWSASLAALCGNK